MKSRVKVVITALPILLFAVSLLVSCSDDVIEIKNNEHAYSEVLESNGVFVYKEQRYETLQTVVDSIAKGGGIQEEAITLSGNVKTRGITIPEKTHLVIDLKGYEIQFFDVEKSAINVGTNSSITVSNGSLTLFDKSSNLIVLSAGGDNSTVTLLTDLTIKAEGQIALYFDEGTSATLKKDVIIEGAVIAKGGKEKTELTAENYLGDVRMNGASLIVSERGCAVVNENNNENSYVESPTGTIIDNTGSIGPENVEKGVCYIKRGDVYYTFGGLKEAFISLVEDNEKVIFISDEDTEASEDFSLNRFVEVDFKGYKSGKNNISLESGSTLTLKSSSDISIFAGTITSAAGEASSLVLDNVEMKNSISVSGTLIATSSIFNDNITSTGDLTLTSSSFQSATADKPVVKSTAGSISMTKVTGVAGAVTASATGKDVTISNAEATATLTTGAVTAGNAVSLTGVSGKIVTVDGNVAGTSLSSDYAIIKGTVDLSGNLTSSSSEFHGAVTANAVIDTGSTFRSNITSTGDLTLTSSSFQSATADKPVVKSTAGSISMTKVTGVAGAVTASATGKDVTISNAEATATLTTGAVTAGNAVSLTGVSGKIVTVDGSISGSSLVANYANLLGSVIATTSVEASNCTVGDGEAYIYSPVTSISNSKFKLTKIIGGVIGNIDVEADSLTITSPILYSTPSEKSSVSLIKVKNLTVTADNSVFSAGNVVVSKKAAINGGTYTGEFVFSGSEDSTIEAGAFSGPFSKTGNAALNITAGYFTGTSQTLNSGSTIIDGEHSSTSGWNTTFENLSVVSGTCVIKSGFFKASDAIQLNSLGSCISQDTMVSETKFVEIAYTGASIGGGSVSELSLPDSANKVIISFYGTNYGESSYDDSGYPVLASTLTFTYPVKEKVELKGRIVSNDNDYRVYANGRTLEGKELTGEESESIIWRRKGDSSPYSYEIVKAVQDGTQYLYHYDTVVVNYYTGNGTPANTTHYVSQAVCPGVVPVKFLTASEAGKDITDSADYRFTWNTGSANYGTEEYRGGGTDYLPTDYIPSLSENLNVYSYWYKPYITYKPNGATTGEDKIDVTAYNGSYTVWDNTGNGSFAKTGYTLSSWNTASAGSGTSYAKSDTLTNVIEDKTVYAIWTANTYTVKFDANGGTGTAMADLSFTYDEEKALTANTYTRTDYTFKGWSTSSSATTAQYNNSQSVSNLTAVQNGTVTLYAVWEENGKIFNRDNVVILGKNSSLYTDSELSTPAPGGTVSGNYKVYDIPSSGKYFSSKGTSYTVLSEVKVWNDNDARSSSNLNKDEMSAYGQTIMDKICTKYEKDIFVSSSIWGSDVTAHYCYFKGGSINVYSNGINTLIAEGKNYALSRSTGTF